MCMGGAAGKVISPIPIDPITTKALEKAPAGVRNVATAPTRLLGKAVGQDAAKTLLAPIGGNEASDKQAKVLLGS